MHPDIARTPLGKELQEHVLINGGVIGVQLDFLQHERVCTRRTLPLLHIIALFRYPGKNSRPILICLYSLHIFFYIASCSWEQIILGSVFP